MQVDDQMKLLQHSWSDMLVLDHLHHRIHNNLPDDAPLPNGQKFDLLALALLGVPASISRFNEITVKLQEIKFDAADYICLKFLLLLNPGLCLSFVRLDWFWWYFCGLIYLKVNILQTCVLRIQSFFNGFN